MKKLESLKSSKFGALENYELKNLLAVTGGRVYSTTWYEMGNPDNHGGDRWHVGDGSEEDYIFKQHGDMEWTSKAPVLDLVQIEMEP